MMKKINRRSFLKVLGIAGAACAMTALTGCDEEGMPSTPAGDGSTPLSYLKPLNGSFTWENKIPEDPYGNTYMKGVNYSVFTALYSNWKGTYFKEYGVLAAKAEYVVDRKYSKLTMKLNPHKMMGEEGWGYVRVLADKKLVATSEVIRQKTRETVQFEADITGATYIEVEPVVRYQSSMDEQWGGIIMWDVKLWK